ncbi:MAG: capsule assembly Wzi family protein, partial [Deltaproteobacteria bacterium]
MSAFTRLRLEGGNHDYSRGFEVDRAYLNAELGPVALEAGRDVQKLGPGARTSL